MDLRLNARHCLQTLGLEPGASQEQIRKAWRELAAQWHPDKVAHNPKLQAIAQEEMKTINAAYEFLKLQQPDSQASSASAQAEAEKERDAEKEREKEQERRERETKRRERETERLRVQQEAEAAFQSEQLNEAKKEAIRKEEEAKRSRAQEKTENILTLYEAVYIVTPDLADPQIALITNKYKRIVEMYGGIVKQIDVWERRKLQYEIKGFKEGIFVVMAFRGSARTEATLRQALNVSEDQIRFLVTVSEVNDTT